MWYTSLLTFQHVTYFSLINYLTEIWHHKLTIHLKNFANRMLSRLFYPCGANWMKLQMKLTIKILRRFVIYYQSKFWPLNCLLQKMSIHYCQNRLFTMERQCWANAHYSRLECLDIVGIPREVSGKYWRRRYLIFLTKSIAAFLQIILNPDVAQQKEQYSYCWVFSTKGLGTSLAGQKMELKMEDFDLPGSNKLFI